MPSRKITVALVGVIVLIGLAAAGALVRRGPESSTVRAGGASAGSQTGPDLLAESDPSVPPTTAEPTVVSPTTSSTPAANVAPPPTAKVARLPEEGLRSTTTTPTRATSTTVATATPAWKAPEACRGLFEVDPTSGTARQLLPQPTSQMSWSPDGQLLAYLRPSGGRFEKLVAVLDASTGSERVLRQASGANYGAPQWTPDGQTIVVVENFTAAAAPGSVLAINVASGDARTIRRTSTSDPVGDLSLSPDGRRIAFGRADTSIRVMNIDGTGERQVVAGIRRSGPMPWSRAGEEIAYTVLSDDGGVFVLNMTTDVTRRLTTGNASGVAWAPVGDRLVATLSGVIHVIEHSTGATRSIAQGSEAVWSPNADSIAYGRVGPQEGTPERPIQRNDILVAKAEGPTPRLVVEDLGGHVTAPVVWSPTGDRILAACR